MEETHGESSEQSPSTKCLVNSSEVLLSKSSLVQPMHADVVHQEAEDDVVRPFCQEELVSEQDLVTCYSCHQATHKICFLGFLPHIEPASNSISCPLCIKNMSKWSWFRQFSADNCNICKMKVMENSIVVLCLKCGAPIHFFCFLAWVDEDIKPESLMYNCNICKRKVMENSIAVLCLKCGAPIHFFCFLAWVDEDIKPESLMCRGCSENVDTWQLYKQLEKKYLLDPNFNCGRCMKGFVDGDLMFNIIDCDHNVCEECLLITLASNMCSRCGVRIEDMPPWPYRFIEVNYGVPFVPLNAAMKKLAGKTIISWLWPL